MGRHPRFAEAGIGIEAPRFPSIQAHSWEKAMTRLSYSKRISPATWAGAGVEPSLEEILADPIIGMVMQRDAVTADEVRSVMRVAASCEAAGFRCHD